MLEEINRALSGYEGLFDNHRWADIYQSGFRYFFTNLRDVKRFINGFSFNFLLVSSEVNVGDFMAIEALRVFAPNVYQGIAQNKHLFTSFWNPAQKEELRPRFDEIFAQASLTQKLQKSGYRIISSIEFRFITTSLIRLVTMPHGVRRDGLVYPIISMSHFSAWCTRQ